MVIDWDAIIRFISIGINWPFQLPGLDGFKLGIGWVILLIGVIAVIFSAIKKIIK